MTARFLHTMLRITDPDRSRAFYEALGFQFASEMDIVRNGEREATNYFFSLGRDERVLELTYNHDGRTYDLGTGSGHIAIRVDDPWGMLDRLKELGIELERPPYQVRKGGSLLCFVRDPDSCLSTSSRTSSRATALKVPLPSTRSLPRSTVRRACPRS